MQKITLEKIHHDIVEWRKSKKYKCEPIPQQIWESIRQIHKEYKKEEIIKTLGIKLSMYKISNVHIHSIAACVPKNTIKNKPE